MAADPVSRPGQLQMRDIAFAAQILHIEKLKQNDTSFNRTAVKKHEKIPTQPSLQRQIGPLL
ncbi:MAG: hypothetical protein ACKOEG_08165 [Chthoniobacterales bacterium]